MDDIGSAVKNFDESIPSLRKIFECIRTSGVKLSPNKYKFATQKVKFFRKIITPEGIQPESKRIEKFLKTIKLPEPQNR